ncbi:MAG: restriction endonuclease subunit S [Candidatus Aminicenantes bacterium]|nr:restriction endonuclease subunit S [Candidatus Aminicenantes bacterium]
MGRVESLRTENKLKKTDIGEIPVDWEVARIGDTCEVVGGSTPLTTTKEFWDGDIPWAIPTDITKLKGNIISITEKIITERGLSNCAARLLPVGSILLTSRATIGECAINSKSMATNQGFASLICKDKVYNWFIFYRIKYMRKEIERLGSGSTFNEVSKKSIRELKIPIPPLSEQKKIAEILTSMDEAIEKKQEIIEKTKMLKKGLMQELLTRGIGHNKFKKTEIGEIPVDWEVKKIKDTGKIITGNTPPTKNLEYYNNDYLWATPGDLGTSKYIEFTARMLSRKGIEVSRLIPRDSILVVCIGSTIGKVGMALHDMATNQQINSIICNKSWNPHFVYYWMLENSDYLVSMAGKHAVPIINKTLFSLFSIPNPSKDEQSTIGLILNSLDEEIEKEMAHKERLEGIKKGLMQVLLTGKIRAKI